ncbi:MULTISPECIES: transposase domain-containing protein [Burkholderia]|uniref:transposase domain-containing protein n=1 Tax=Burkholderia TaxID=32008 RepID=UPI0008421288|nr:transposase domain-containing protein [Burkholderia sp. MSMB175]AOK31893.1 hypothetical protein AQ611_20545 [Burkholderia sp. Bp7605]
MFADTVNGASASANRYASVETCRANRLDAYRYLAWPLQHLLLAKTADDYDALLRSKIRDEPR